MNAKRTDPRLHAYQRPMSGAYVPAASTTPAHLAAVFAAERERLAAVFAAERERLAAAAKPRRKRRQATDPQQAPLQLVA